MAYVIWNSSWRWSLERWRHCYLLKWRLSFLPCQAISIVSVAAGVPVRSHQGIIMYIPVGALSCLLKSSRPCLALLPAVSPLFRPSVPAGWNELTHGLKERWNQGQGSLCRKWTWLSIDKALCPLAVSLYEITLTNVTYPSWMIEQTTAIVCYSERRPRVAYSSYI
jgi:hypothetical protein